MIISQLFALIMIATIGSRAFRMSILKNAKQNVFKMSISSTSNKLATLASTKLVSNPTSPTQYVFVGGKGGVGKTSTSSAIAIALSDSGLRTLIVSTDPAHSLGDALDVNLSSGKIEKIQTESSLWALEIDVEDALKNFKENAKGLSVEGLSKSFGVPQEILTSLGLDDLTSLFTNPPPGIDEIVALVKVFQYGDVLNDKGEPRFQRIVIDTAPTGHTVRLLQLPDFLNSVTGKLIKLRSKITSAVDMFKSFMGGGGSDTMNKPTTANPLEQLEILQTNMMKMQTTLKNPKLTQFVIVCIPTVLALAETRRLLNSLQLEKIQVSTIVCNQIISDQVGQKYLMTRSNSQKMAITKLTNQINQIKQQQKKSNNNIEITEVPYVDTEVMGLYGLKFFATLAHPVKARSASNPIDSRKLTIFGGKGGVGKTTSSSSWAVQLADAGFRTLIVSTDPAHSLGDALQESLHGLPRRLDTPSLAANGGQLWAMEVDPQAALKEFKEIVSDVGGAGGGSEDSDNSGGGFMGGMVGAMMPDLKADLMDMLSGVQDPPPGTDEVVALTKIVGYLTNGYTLPNGDKITFDRVVLDTAPTGHTLRMLQLPPFLLQIVSKLKSIRAKTGGGSGSNGKDNNGVESIDRLDRFEKSMIKLQDMLHNPRECEFTVVTIPTELATAESGRLLESLQEEDILVRRVIINQVLPSHTPAATTAVDAVVVATENSVLSSSSSSSAADVYLNRLRQGQTKCLNELNTIAREADGSHVIPVIQIPYFDMEVRTVYGLRTISNYLFPVVKKEA